MKDHSSVYTIYLKGNFTEITKYVDIENCHFPLNTFSISSTLENETDIYPLVYSSISYKNDSFYKINCVLYNFNSDYIGPFRMTKLSTINSNICNAVESEDTYIINLVNLDDNTIFGNTDKNVLTDPYLVGSNHGNKVIVNYSKSYNDIIISYVGELMRIIYQKLKVMVIFLIAKLIEVLRLGKKMLYNKRKFPNRK